MYQDSRKQNKVLLIVSKAKPIIQFLIACFWIHGFSKISVSKGSGMVNQVRLYALNITSHSITVAWNLTWQESLHSLRIIHECAIFYKLACAISNTFQVIKEKSYFSSTYITISSSAEIFRISHSHV